MVLRADVVSTPFACYANTDESLMMTAGTQGRGPLLIRVTRHELALGGLVEADKPNPYRLLESLEDARQAPLESVPRAAVAEVVQRIAHENAVVPRVPVAAFGSSI